MEAVYIVQHSYEVGEGGEFDETKVIGVFSSEKKAKEIVEEYKKISGFKEYPSECFYIDKYELDKKHWEEGFFKWSQITKSEISEEEY